MTTTTLIVDDELDMRLLVRIVIELANDGLSIIGEAGDGDEALDVFRSMEEPDPDVVILDNRMPTVSGLEAAREILSERPDQIVILYSAYLDDETRERAKQIGIAACLAKQDIENLADTIRELVGAQG